MTYYTRLGARIVIQWRHSVTATNSAFFGTTNVDVAFTARATTISDPYVHLQTFTYTVTGPGNGFTPTVVGQITVSGNDSTQTLIWHPNYPGLWTVSFSATDSLGYTGNSIKTNFEVVDPYYFGGNSGSYLFQVMVDVNQLSSWEANSIAAGNSVLSGDGIWAILENSTGISDATWTQVLAEMGARNWAISEDNPWASSEFNHVSSVIGRTVDGSFDYVEKSPYLSASDSVLTPAQIAGLVPTNGASIILDARNYDGAGNLTGSGTHTGYFVNIALTDPFVAGIAFETPPLAPTSNYDSSLQLNAGVNAVLAAGKALLYTLPSCEALD